MTINSVAAEILLVEDNQDDVDLTLHTLARENLANNIVVVRDGEEALEYLFCRGDFAGRSFDDPPRLVLLDLKLPKVDGIAVLRQIKADERTKIIPVVILTSSKEESDIMAGYDNGANSYVVKPIQRIEFEKAIEHVGLYWLIVNALPAAKK